MAFHIKPDRKETENKTIRFPLDVVHRIEAIMEEGDISFSGFVIQACEYVIEEMELGEAEGEDKDENGSEVKKNGLGERLRLLRLRKGLSQKELAQAMGVSSSVISNYEKGARSPGLEVLVEFAVFFGCSTDYLLGIQNRNARMLSCPALTDKQYGLLQELLMSL